MSAILDWTGWDGTAAMERSRNNEIQDAQVKSAATGEQIPMEKARQMAESLLEVTDLRVASENSLIDAGVDAALTAATIALLIPSGGTSVSMMALSRFPSLARGAAVVARATEGLSKVARIEAMATYFQNASRVTQLTAAGLAGGTFKLGAHQTLGSRFDATTNGATAFADGFVNTVGNVVGAKDLAVLQGTFRKSGERAAARLGTEFLEQGGKAFVKAEAKELAGKGMSTILQEALANGVDKFDQKIVRELAEQMVKAEVKGPLREQALAQLTKEITQQLEQQLLLDGKTVFKQMLRESLLNMEGGALGGLGSGAVHWNPNASVSENIQQALVSTATGAGMAAAFTVGMRAAAYSFDAISSRAAKMLGRETPVIDAANPQIAAQGKTRIPQVND